MATNSASFGPRRRCLLPAEAGPGVDTHRPLLLPRPPVRRWLPRLGRSPLGWARRPAGGAGPRLAGWPGSDRRGRPVAVHPAWEEGAAGSRSRGAVLAGTTFGRRPATIRRLGSSRSLVHHPQSPIAQLHVALDLRQWGPRIDGWHCGARRPVSVVPPGSIASDYRDPTWKRTWRTWRDRRRSHKGDEGSVWKRVVGRPSRVARHRSRHLR